MHDFLLFQLMPHNTYTRCDTRINAEASLTTVALWVVDGTGPEKHVTVDKVDELPVAESVSRKRNEEPWNETKLQK